MPLDFGWYLDSYLDPYQFPERPSPAKHALEDTSHQTRPKIDAYDTSLLMGSIN